MTDLTIMTDEDIADFLTDAMHDHHDMDVGFASHAKNLVEKLRAAGMLAVAPLDIDSIRKDLDRLTARAAKLDKNAFVTLSIWPTTMGDACAVNACMTNLGSIFGNTPAEAIAATEAALDAARKPDEAEGWAILGGRMAAEQGRDAA